MKKIEFILLTLLSLCFSPSIANAQTGDKHFVSVTLDETKAIISIENNKWTENFISKLPLTLESDLLTNTNRIVCSYIDSTDVSDCLTEISDTPGTVYYYPPTKQIVIIYELHLTDFEGIPIGKIKRNVENLANTPSSSARFELIY